MSDSTRSIRWPSQQRRSISTVNVWPTSRPHRSTPTPRRPSAPLLAATYYNGSFAYTRAATAFAVIDATNLTVGPFTAIGTQCLVELYANYCFNAGATDTGNQVWCLFTHGGGQISGGYHVFAKGAGATLATNATPTPTTARILVTGLVAGTSYQWDWAWDVTAASTTASITTGSATSGTGATTDYGPAMMRVFAA